MCKIEDQQQSPETGVLTDHYVEPEEIWEISLGMVLRQQINPFKSKRCISREEIGIAEFLLDKDMIGR